MEDFLRPNEWLKTQSDLVICIVNCKNESMNLPVVCQTVSQFVVWGGFCLFTLLGGRGFPGGSDDKESICNAGDLSLIPGLGRSPGEGNSYPLQYFSLENSMDREAWQATVRGVAKSWTRLSVHSFFRFLSMFILVFGHTVQHVEP